MNTPAEGLCTPLTEGTDLELLPLLEGEYIQSIINQENKILELSKYTVIPHCFASLAHTPASPLQRTPLPRFLTVAPQGFDELLSRNRHQGY